MKRMIFLLGSGLFLLGGGLFLPGCGGVETTSPPTPIPPPSPAPPATNTPAKTTGSPAAAPAVNSDYVTVGKDNWLFLPTELEFLAKGEFWGPKATNTSVAAKPDWADPLPAIVDFHTKLEAKGIDLLLLPVPPKAQIYADKLPEATGMPMAEALQTFYGKLREAGVEVLDLTEDFAAAKAETPTHCRTDTHWTPAAIERAADAIHAKYQDTDWAKAITRRELVSEASEFQHRGDLTIDTGVTLPPETLTVNRVGTKRGDKLAPLEPDPDSPILVLGDSHTLFCHEPSMVTNGGGLSDHLALRFGAATDLIGLRGSASTAARLAMFSRQMKSQATNTQYLSRKKLVVWCFAAREFTESSGGWRVLPIEK